MSQLISIRKQLLLFVAALVLQAVNVVHAQDDYFYDRLLNKGYEIINIENKGVQGFLDDTTYNNRSNASNYKNCIVTKYSKGAPPRPAGITLKWESETPVEDLKWITVMLVESTRERHESLFDGDLSTEPVKFYYPDLDSKEYLLRNMTPGRYCYYQVEETLQDGSKNILTRGSFYAEGFLRMLRVDGMTNVRDFGGWETSFGRRVAYGRIFRGSRPETITDRGRIEFVINEGITADLDLRGSNLGKSPFCPPNDVEYYCTNNQRYKLALTSYTEALAKDLNILADVLGRGGNVFLHCNHGANRAGTLSFLIEGILGLSEADLRRDYELSAFAYGSVRISAFSEMVPYIRTFGSGGDSLAQCFYNFARKIGVSEKNLDTIRCQMLGLDPNSLPIKAAHRR